MSSSRSRARDRILPPLVSFAGPALLRTLGATWRVERHGLDPFVERREGRGTRRYVIALWHASLLPLAYAHRGEHATVLVSRHGDGELIVRVLRRLGYEVARGSTTRGGSAALRALIRVARESRGDLAITPDGPKGPPRRAQQGVAALAAVTGFPILPLGIACSRAWRLRSWDRFCVPKPFARIAIVADAPIEVPREALDGGLDAYLARYEAAMQRAEADALGRLAP